MAASAEVFTSNLPTVNSPLEPIVGPPTNASINGIDFFRDQTAVGLTPTLRWAAPTIGTANAYQVVFCYFEASSGGGVLRLEFTCIGSIQTTTTAVKVPPGILEAGKHYFVTLTAISQPGLDITTAPFKNGFPRATTQAVSGVISP